MAGQRKLTAKSTELLLEFPLVILALIIVLVLVLLIIDSNLLMDLFEQYGAIGIFTASIIANASILLPVPFDGLMLLLPTLEHNAVNLVFLALLAGVGAAIGELTSYLIGYFGIHSLEKYKKQEFLRIQEIREKLYNKGGMLLIFIFSAMPFVPFDLVGIAAGIIKYDIKKFFLPALFGKFVRYIVIVLGVFYGVPAIIELLEFMGLM